jgi:anion-transporting  ArsA/GET3 family ATPase
MLSHANLNSSILTKRCIMVCGGGGVGKTTIAASVAISAARVRKRVLVVTIDPAKRLLQAFGFENAFLQEGGEPLSLSPEIKLKLGLSDEASLSVAVLNPKYVLNQILEQTLAPDQREKLKNTVLFKEMSQMIYGLQEYTAYEWVTRMIQNDEYDLIVLDTPPAFHAKDFFSAPEKIKNLMESRVFQLFLPKKTFFGSLISFSWVEKLLGRSLFGESKIFFEMFTLLRTRILERCDLLSKFFKNDQVAVVAVTTPESTAQLELEGLMSFLNDKEIPVSTLIVNQVETKPSLVSTDSRAGQLSQPLQEKLKLLRQNQETKAEVASQRISLISSRYPGVELIPASMNYSHDGFEILKANSFQLK